MESSNGNGQILLYFEPNSSVPTGADTSNSNWWQWSAGDVLRFTVPLAGGGTSSTTLAFDASASCAYDVCGATGTDTVASIGTDVLQFANSTSVMSSNGGEGVVSSATPVVWTLDAVAGEFSLGGYRISYANGRLNGTGAGALDQSSVVDVTTLNTGGGVPDIDTSKTSYTVSEINNNSVSTTFDGGTLELSSSGTVTQDFTVNATGGTISTASGTVQFDGAFSGAGDLTKTGAANLRLTGNSTHTGRTSVAAGTLTVDGTLGSSDVIVALGAFLRGSGTIGGNVRIDGELSPGSSPGTMTVGGNVTMTNSGTLTIEIDGATYNPSGGAGSYDRTVLTGASSVFTADGTVTPVLRGISGPANNTYTPNLGDTFRIVTTPNNPNGVTGTFDTVTRPTSGMTSNTTFGAVYGNNFIDLAVIPLSFEVLATGTGSRNAAKAAAAFDRISSSSTVNGAAFIQSLYNLGSTALARAMIQSSGEIHAFALADVQGSVRSLMHSSNHHRSHGDIWVDVSGSIVSHSDNSISSAHEATNGHLWIGREFLQYSGSTYGLALGVSNSSTSSTISGDASQTTFALAGYMNGAINGWQTEANFGLAYSALDTDRSIILSTGTSSHSGEGRVISAFGSYGLSRGVPSISQMPATIWAQLEAQALWGRSYEETGAQTSALNVGSSIEFAAQLTAGYRIERPFEAPNGSGLLFGGFNLEQQVVPASSGVVRDIGFHGQSWEVSSPTGSRTMAGVTLGANYLTNSDWEIRSSLDFGFSKDYSKSALRFRVERKF